jgi:hypothetical protein
MFNQSTSELKSLARSRIERAGLLWPDLQSQAAEIIVFGSFALSAATELSDLDVLCIGDGQRIRSPDLHLIWISPKRIASAEWLCSELATHVAAYGKWIKGENTWALCKVPGERAMQRKKRRICQRTQALVKYWHDLGPQYKEHHLLHLRRDLQRFVMMKAGEAPVPKVFLDRLWANCTEPNRWKLLVDQIPEVASQLEFIIALSHDSSNSPLPDLKRAD